MRHLIAPIRDCFANLNFHITAQVLCLVAAAAAQQPQQQQGLTPASTSTSTIHINVSLSAALLRTEREWSRRRRDETAVALRSYIKDEMPGALC